MANMTLSIPDDLLKELKKHSYIKWSEVARIAFEEKVSALERIDVFKEFQEAERDFKDGKSISLEQLKKELGINDL
ncbi:MAG: hypothetical protein PHX47_04255 [Candidatus ainarchaeum sp.]|jgi:hypothetical protein|nr:hypothetical protein [Candidatus ainarchaeum sp.]